MANYIIIGGDGKHYGPIAEGDLRKWIAEGRLNAQSLAKGEGDAEFRPLGTFPELADAFAAPAAPPSIAPVLPVGGGGSDRQFALDKVRVPAIGLIISSGISFLMALYYLLTIGSMRQKIEQMDSMFAQNPQAQQFMDTITKYFSGPFGMIQYLLMILMSILIFIGALKMLKLQSYEFAYAAAILAVIPCLTPCCGWILGVIFGIWAMVALGKAKAHFT